MITIDILKLVFWLFWVGMTILMLVAIRDNKKENGHFMGSVIFFVAYLVMILMSILIYGGVYWW